MVTGDVRRRLFFYFKQPVMKKSTLNFFIDALLFFSLCAITGIGLLIKYTLPSGQDRWAIYGNNHEFLFLNMDRHQWGDIHFAVSIVMIMLLILHIVLHWQFVTTVFRRLVNHSPIKLLTGTVFGFIAIILIAFPFFITPTQVEGGQHLQHSKHLTSIKTEIEHRENLPVKNKSGNHSISEESNQAEHQHRYEINGQMTLAEVSRKYNVPISIIKTQLKLESANANERLGRLKKQYGFTMSEIEDIISNYHQKQ